MRCCTIGIPNRSGCTTTRPAAAPTTPTTAPSGRTPPGSRAVAPIAFVVRVARDDRTHAGPAPVRASARCADLPPPSLSSSSGAADLTGPPVRSSRLPGAPMRRGHAPRTGGSHAYAASGGGACRRPRSVAPGGARARRRAHRHRHRHAPAPRWPTSGCTCSSLDAERPPTPRASSRCPSCRRAPTASPSPASATPHSSAGDHRRRGRDPHGLDAPSAVELPEVQVTASPNVTTALTSPQPTSILDHDQLRVAQAPSLGETINGLAGVHSINEGPGDREAGHPGPELESRARARQRPADRDPGLGRRALAQHRDGRRRADRGDPGAGERAVRLGRARWRGQRGQARPARRDRARPARSAARCRPRTARTTSSPTAPRSSRAPRAGWASARRSPAAPATISRTPVGDVFNTGNRAVAGNGSLGYRGSWGSVRGRLRVPRREAGASRRRDSDAVPAHRRHSRRRQRQPPDRASLASR